MVKAQFKLGWFTFDCSGDTPSKAFLAIEKEQDISCLINQAFMFGEVEQGEELLNEFYTPARDGELTLEKLRTLNIKFEPGQFRCISAEVVDP
ncbi:MAG: hypothetical protein MJ142_02730 [Clostridia bacterium]|nr:hypothetical protein [Clostridia bacterium]